MREKQKKEEKQNQSDEKKKKKRILIIIILIILLLLLLCCGASLVLYKRGGKREDQPEGSPAESSVVSSEEEQEVPAASEDESAGDDSTGSEDEQVEEVSKDVSEKFFFMRAFNSDTYEDNELWMINFDGTEAQSLGITNVSMVFNGNSNGWIYYITQDAIDTIHAYNYITGEQKDIVEAEPFARIEYVSVPYAGDIIVYYVLYFKEDGEGMPIYTDPYPQAKEGHFSYDIENDTKAYLGSFRGIGRWDEEMLHVYSKTPGQSYHEYDLSQGYYRINVRTGERTFLGAEEKNGDIKYFLEEKNMTFIYRPGGLGCLFILTKDGVEQVIEDLEWADTQPNDFSISPERDYVIYSKSHYDEMYQRDFYDLILLDLSTLQKKALMSPQGYENYERVSWIDESRFITLFEKGIVPADERDLFLFNVDTGEKKQLTSFGDVSLFYWLY